VYTKKYNGKEYSVQKDHDGEHWIPIDSNNNAYIPVDTGNFIHQWKNLVPKSTWHHGTTTTGQYPAVPTLNGMEPWLFKTLDPYAIVLNPTHTGVGINSTYIEWSLLRKMGPAVAILWALLRKEHEQTVPWTFSQASTFATPNNQQSQWLKTHAAAGFIGSIGSTTGSTIGSTIGSTTGVKGNKGRLVDEDSTSG